MTNLKRVDLAIGAYAPRLDDAQRAQLAFFRGLWGEQAAITEQLARPYEAPDTDVVARLAAEQMPVLHVAPARIDAEALVQATGRMADALCAGGGFSGDDVYDVRAVDWDAVCAAGLPSAGSDPQAAIDAQIEALEEQGLSGAALQIAASAASLALRALIEPAAEAIMKAREAEDVSKLHPVLCPTCGCGATLAIVGAASSTMGGARRLYCAQCGTTWDFDRVRCARCGTHNQGHLRYRHVGDDDAHRVHLCSECGGYVRTAFQENALAPLVPEVEDVVMARLDLVGQQQAEERA